MLSLVCVSAVVLPGCSAEHDTTRLEPLPHATLDEQRLWDESVADYLDDELWRDRDAYDAGSHLMIPLHAAFRLDAPDWREQFHAHFSRFAKAPASEWADSQVHRLQYLYLVSRYLVLAEESGEMAETPVDLARDIESEIVNLWTVRPAWQWERDDFDSMSSRLLWKLEAQDEDPRYLGALIDEELFVFAIAADLRRLRALRGEEPDACLTDIADLSYDAFTNLGVWLDSTHWLLQPGVWSDSQSYRYAGHDSLGLGLEPKPVIGIASDTSHSHRLGRWLLSLEEASSAGRARAYSRIRSGVALQFLDAVVVPPSAEFEGLRTTNYMDGHNGVYRYEYGSLAEGEGYGPWGLSGTFNHGWWAFGGSGIQNLYASQAELFPLDESVLSLYMGPQGTRDRNSAVRLPESYTNGLIELIISLAARPEVCS